MLVNFFYWTEHTIIELRFCEITFKRILSIFLLNALQRIVHLFQISKPWGIYGLKMRNFSRVKIGALLSVLQKDRRQYKISSSKKVPVKGLCGRCLFVWDAEPHIPYPLHTVYVYTVYLFTQGKGRVWTREKVRLATVHKAGSKIPTWPTVSPVCNNYLWCDTCACHGLAINTRHGSIQSRETVPLSYLGKTDL